jgi:hypothetical protein
VSYGGQLAIAGTWLTPTCLPKAPLPASPSGRFQIGTSITSGVGPRPSPGTASRPRHARSCTGYPMGYAFNDVCDFDPLLPVFDDRTYELPVNTRWQASRSRGSQQPYERCRSTAARWFATIRCESGMVRRPDPGRQRLTVVPARSAANDRQRAIRRRPCQACGDSRPTGRQLTALPAAPAVVSSISGCTAAGATGKLLL